MPRLARVDIGGKIYHVINRANGRLQIFNNTGEYALFERLMLEAKELTDMRILAYVVMPNHWHLVLHPRNEGDMSAFMHRLTNAHTRNVHARTGTTGSGHLYQGRYKSFLVDTDQYFLSLVKYVERNPVRAQLATRCEDWQWGSAWRRTHKNEKGTELVDPPPIALPHDYEKWINEPEKEKALGCIRHSVNKGVPYGRERWVETMVTTHHLESTLRSVGRPRKIA